MPPTGGPIEWVARFMFQKKDVFIRVSVGGSESEKAKIERCKALAEKALSRL